MPDTKFVTPELFAAEIKPLKTQLDALRSVGMAATENIIHHVTTNLLNPNEIETGKLINGALDASFSTTGTSGFISVKTGDVIRCLYLRNGDLDKIVITSYALYDATKSLLAHGDSSVYSVTATTDGYVRVSFAKSYLPDLGVVKNKTAAEWTWEEYYEPYNTYTADFLTSETASKISVLEDLSFIKDSPFESACDVLTGDTVLRVLGTDAKRNYSISFRGDVTTVGTLIITNGNQSSYLSGWVEADDTNIKVYTKEGSSPVLVGTYPHGLNLVGKINVSIIAKKWKKADIVITTSGDENTQGGLFVQADVDWFGNHGYAFTNLALGSITANTDGGHYTNCELKFYCSDYQHDLWAFGDSYFDHWPVIAIQNGYSNWAVDGASGRNSTQAFNSLSLAMQKRIPRKILWCMGMNDEDTETAVNARWLNNYNKVKTLCETNGIELILCTIPCNSRPNNYKNAIIKASGLRYVDIANAVGGEELNSSWYDGLLSGDGVHPTLLGDKVIAARFMADVPELMDVF